MIKKLINLMINKAPKQQYYLEIGAHFLKKGVGKQIGDPISVGKDNKSKTYYIANLHFDFANNRVNHTLTNKRPIEKK